MERLFLQFEFCNLHFTILAKRVLVPPRRFERPANRLGICCSIHLSYGGNFHSSQLLRAFPANEAYIISHSFFCQHYHLIRLRRKSRTRKPSHQNLWCDGKGMVVYKETHNEARGHHPIAMGNEYLIRKALCRV